MVYGNESEDRFVTYTRECPRAKADNRNGDITGVPLQYRDADLTKFEWSTYKNVEHAKEIHSVISDFFHNFEDWQKEGKGLYIWSNTSGSGKTLLACCLAKSVMIRYDIQMRFISVPDYFELLSENMKDKQAIYDKTKVYQTCQLLVLDDVGTQPNKEWYESQLFRLVDKRMNNGLITIFTSNYDVYDLKNQDRLVDRIEKGALPLQFPEEPIRRNKNAEETKAFLKRRGLIKGE